MLHLVHRSDLGMLDADTGRRRRFQQPGVQGRPAHTAPGAAVEPAGHPALAVDVGDAVKRLARCFHPEGAQHREGMRHQPLAARFVDGSVASLDHDDLEARSRAEDRGGQPCRSAARDQQVDHRSLASAAFSTPSRVRNTTALSTVNTTAVIHAVCTKGRAIPSTTTAT